MTLPNMELEAISDIIVKLSNQFCRLILFLVLESNRYQSSDDDAQQIQQIYIIHCENSVADLTGVRRTCSRKSLRSNMST